MDSATPPTKRIAILGGFDADNEAFIRKASQEIAATMPASPHEVYWHIMRVLAVSQYVDFEFDKEGKAIKYKGKPLEHDTWFDELVDYLNNTTPEYNWWDGLERQRRHSTTKKGTVHGNRRGRGTHARWAN